MGSARTALRDVLTMLCVGIALVFAGAYAAGVVDGAQHSAGSPHEHHVSLTAASGADHHAHGQDHNQQSDDEGGDLQTGPGHHHHSEPPAAALAMLDATICLTSSPMRVGTGADGSRVQGVRPGGLERPPRSAVIDA